MAIHHIDQNNSIVNITNSILKVFGISGPNNVPCPRIDDILNADENRGKKICLILLQGLGRYDLSKNRGSARYLASHQNIDMDCVYPSTSLCNLIALEYGMYPIQSGWIGDFVHLPEIDMYVDMDNGAVHGSSIFSGINPRQFLQDKYTLVDCINAIGGRDDCAVIVDGNAMVNAKNRQSSGMFFTAIEDIIRNKASRFVLAHSDAYEKALIKNGFSSREVKYCLEAFDRSMETLVERNPDVIFIVCGDHGHIKTSWIDINKYPDFVSTLKEPKFSISPRIASFRVKDQMGGEFERTFLSHFSEDFDMYTQSQIYMEHIFGYGSEFEHFKSMLGDYVLIAKKNKSFTDGDVKKLEKIVSGGASVEERTACVGFYNIGKK